MVITWLLQAGDIASLMGFGGFGTTKGQHVDGNAKGFVMTRRAKPRKFRQYMNRKGGFNRPLDFVQ